MRLLPLFLCAVASLCIANMETLESADLGETTELAHGLTEIHAAAKVQPKVAAKTPTAVSSKAKSGKESAMLKARVTEMIGTHEFDSTEVSMARAKLHQVVQKMGTRHPEFLGEAAQVSSLVQNGAKAGYVAGGYLRLKKILAKIDTFEEELKLEHHTLDVQRNVLIRKCAKEAKDLNTAMNKFMDDSKDRTASQKQKQDTITRKMGETEDSKARENGPGLEITMATTVKQSASDYEKYWTETEERHQVRNVLMQALWLVCVGFRKFRHTAYCTTLRKQPDFKEGGDSKWIDEGGNDYDTHVKNSIKFAETMTPIWEQQKVADQEAANQLDGDVDMEKGFVNNRAPWGVDPSSAGGEEKEMSTEQMTSRMSFLIQTSYTPPRISAPISGFISALQEGDEATQQSLVQALVDIDRQEGEAQSALDAEWYADMVAGIKTMTAATDSQYEERATQGQLHADNTALHKDMVEKQKEYESLERIKENTVDEGHIAAAKCEVDLVEVEATLEVNEEELVNIMRLNSLLRFLVIGEKAACSDCKNDNRGSCTWMTRGAPAKGSDEDGNNCKNLSGETVPCNYDNSGHEQDYTDRSNVFCACEYGYYGPPQAKTPNGISVSQDCPKMECPGYGRMLYPKTGSALDVSAFPAIAVCSSRHGETHGNCDDSQGICTFCFRDKSSQKTPDNINTALMKFSFPYHGKNRKCEHWMCPTEEVTLDSDEYYYKPADDEKSCSKRGICHHNKYGYATGRCVCNEPYYGHACHMKKCQAREGVWFPATSPNVCNGKGMCQNTNGDVQGACKCSERFHGIYCELKRCPGFDKALSESGKPDGSCPSGTCDSGTGACNCDAGGTACGREKNDQCPTGCAFKGCSKECGNNGRCDRITGECVCANDKLYNGPTCNVPHRCDEKEADWALSMDKWGWSTCKHGYLLVGLKTDMAGSADALYNLNKAVCAKPCEGDARDVIGINTYACYHENWWKKFDTAGGKYCRRNYFVAGLFRSHCNSLYCLEMAKCCQVKKSLWTACEWSKQTGWTGRSTGIRAGNSDGFVVGFWRDATHTLNGITQLRICTPIWWGLFAPESVR